MNDLHELVLDSLTDIQCQRKGGEIDGAIGQSHFFHAWAAYHGVFLD